MPFRIPSVWGDRYFLSSHGRDPDSPSLSDLVEMFLKENVKDPSIVSLSPTASLLSGHADVDVMEVKLNNIIVCWVLNTEAVVRLRQWVPTFATVEHKENSPDCDVPAADPELLEKLWAHIARLDEKIDCKGWSILEKHPSGRTISELKGVRPFFGWSPRTTEEAYPGFNDGP